MRWEEYIDAEEVKKAVSLLQNNGSVFEVRAIGTAKKDIVSGYFRDAETLLKALDTIDVRMRNIYITLSELKEECFARSQSERFLKSPQTTSDQDVERYRWLFVDLDPVRMTGISSSEQELEAANTLAIKVEKYMNGIGFPDPVKAASGNGCHLLYRIDIENNEAGRKIVESCLKVLADLFDTDTVKIDTTNYNPSRICKLHGTKAQKGRSTKDRPHRMSRIISAPDKINVATHETLKALAAELKEPEAQSKRYYPGQTVRDSFDLVNFMRKHGLTYTEDHNDRATIYKLDVCPFNDSHTDGDSKIFLYHDGAIAFKCHHNSCRNYKWQDVRLKYEPDAYIQNADDDNRIDNGYKRHLQEAQKEQQRSSEKKEKKTYRKLKSAENLLQKNIPEPRILIGVGDDLPLLTEGTCILSAKPKLGKSWLALAMCIAVANGEKFLGYQTRKCSTLYLDLETGEALQQKRLKKMLNGATVPKNFYLDTETDSLSNGFVDQIEAYIKEDPDIGLIVIDVFQIIRSQAKSIKESEYEHAYRDITPLNELAQKHHISIILVCHDRKAVDVDDPFANILGSTGLQGAATQMIVMFKKKKDDPIHISVKGKTIDGLPEMNVQLDKGQWSIVEGFSSADREQSEAMAEYRNSDIRLAIMEILDQQGSWRGRCSGLINEAGNIGIGLDNSPKQIGGFLHKHQGRFLKEDNVQIRIIDNGTGPKIYDIHKFTIDTIDENTEATIDGFKKASNYGGWEIPFL